MSYSVKITYQHPDEDVLLLTHHHVDPAVAKVFSDPRIKNTIMLRSKDRTYAEVYMFWSSKEEYQSWAQEHFTEEFHQADQQMQQKLVEIGLSTEYYEPENDDENWTAHFSRRIDLVQYPGSVIEYDDIFKPAA